MSRVAYVNGRYLPHHAAAVHVEDRGYQFADGVYEVCEVSGGRLIDERLHFARLERSLAALSIPLPMPLASLGAVFREIVRRNRFADGLVYAQVTRGVAPRGHAFPSRPVPPSLVVTGHALDPDQVARRAEEGVAVVTVPETRWARVDIKTIGLLANVLAKEEAKRQGAFEAWFVGADGRVTEGSSSNAWIVTAAGGLVTAPADQAILGGISRAVVIAAAEALGLRLELRRFALAEALAAPEAFLTSATNRVMPIVRIDGRPVGTGRPGETARQLRGAFRSHSEVSPLYAGPSG